MSRIRTPAVTAPVERVQVMKERAARNPLLAEKTPRTMYQDMKWSYDPPKGQKAPDKWNYSSEEVGLVSQLGSMAEKVKKEKAREDQYQQRMKLFEEQQRTKDMGGAGNGTARGGSTGRLTGRLSGRGGAGDDSAGVLSSVRSAATETGRSDVSSRLDYPYPSSSSSRSLLQPIQEGSAALSSSMKGKTLSDFPVSSTKTLQASHPEILSKLRAERAAKYVESLSHPLDPPDYSHVSARVPFRPGGGSVKLQQGVRELPGGVKRGPGAGGGKGEGGRSDGRRSQRLEEPLSTERVAESLKSLVKALEETDSEIARQDLKIALAKKVKTFEKRGPKPTATGTAR
jgi:hypothetical protein